MACCASEMGSLECFDWTDHHTPLDCVASACYATLTDVPSLLVPLCLLRHSLAKEGHAQLE